MLQLVENAGSCVDEGQEVGGQDAQADLGTAQGEVLQGPLKDEVDHTQDNGTEASEYQTSVEKFPDGVLDGRFHSLNPILSLTVLS